MIREDTQINTLSNLEILYSSILNIGIDSSIKEIKNTDLIKSTIPASLQISQPTSNLADNQITIPTAIQLNENKTSITINNPILPTTLNISIQPPLTTLQINQTNNITFPISSELITSTNQTVITTTNITHIKSTINNKSYKKSFNSN